MALSHRDAKCVAAVLQAVGDVLAQSPQLLQQLRAAAVADRGLDEAANAATIALVGNPAMTAEALQDLFAATASAVFNTSWPPVRHYLEHQCATPALWRLAAREAVAHGRPAQMLTTPVACCDPEVRSILYEWGDGRLAPARWTNWATADEFARTFGVLASRAALPDALEAYDGIPEESWAALPPTAWEPLARLLTSGRRAWHALLFTTILSRIPAARRDQRVWMFAR